MFANRNREYIHQRNYSVWIICTAQSMFTCLWGEWGGLIGKCWYCALRQLYERRYESEALLLRFLHSNSFCSLWECCLFLGLCKEGTHGLFCKACVWGSSPKDVFTPKGTQAPWLRPPCLQSRPHTPPPVCRHPGLEADCLGDNMGSEGPEGLASALADAEYGPFLSKRRQYCILT